MKFDKRYIFAASLVLAMGLGAYGCSDSDSDDDGGTTTECKGDHKVKNGDKCECESGYKLDGDNCVEDNSGSTDPVKCEGDHKVKNGDKCECESGYKLDGDNCVEDDSGSTEPDKCEGDHKVKNGDKCECESGYKLDGDNCVEDGEDNNKCGENQYFDEDFGECKDNVPVSANCNDGTVQEDEVCDNKDNHLLFKEGYGTCNDWAKENSMPEGEYTGAPACGNTCTRLKKGTCKLEGDTCGNGVIDTDKGEICDIGANANDSKDDLLADGVTCESALGSGEWVEGGKPACPADCKAKTYGNGTCVVKGENDTLGILSCKATITVADQKATGSAEVVAKDDKKVTGAIICAPLSSTLDSIVKNATLDEASVKAGSYDASKADAGKYGCFYVVKAEGQENVVFCSADGSVSSLSTSKTVEDVKLAEIEVGSSVAADVIAKWTFASVNEASLATDIVAGLKAEEGSAKDTLILSWLYVGEKNKNGNDKISVVLTQDAGGTKTALQIKPSAAGDFANTQTKDTNSHLIISDLSSYTLTKVEMTAKYGSKGGKVYITSDNGSAESIVETINISNSNKFDPYSTTKTIPADTKNLHFYGDNESAQAISIDDLSLVGSAK